MKDSPMIEYKTYWYTSIFVMIYLSTSIVMNYIIFYSNNGNALMFTKLDDGFQCISYYKDDYIISTKQSFLNILRKIWLIKLNLFSLQIEMLSSGRT